MKKVIVTTIGMLLLGHIVFAQWTTQPILTLDANKNINYTEPKAGGISKTIFPVMLYSFIGEQESAGAQMDTIPPSGNYWYEANQWGFNIVFTWRPNIYRFNVYNYAKKFEILCNLPYNVYYPEFPFIGHNHLYCLSDEPIASGLTLSQVNDRKSDWRAGGDQDALCYVNFDIASYYDRLYTIKFDTPSYVEKASEIFANKTPISWNGSTLSYDEVVNDINIPTVKIIAFDFYPFRKNGTISDIVDAPSNWRNNWRYINFTQGGTGAGRTTIGKFTSILKSHYPNQAIWPIIQTELYDPIDAGPSSNIINEVIIRNLTFSAIINGADGISFWGQDNYNKPNGYRGDSVTTEENNVWCTTLKQTVELSELQKNYDQVLLNDNFNQTAFNNRFIEYSYKRIGNSNKFYLFSVNNTSSNVKSKIKFPNGYKLNSTPQSIGSYYIQHDGNWKDYRNPNALSVAPVLGKKDMYLNFAGYGTDIVSFNLKKSYADIAMMYKQLSSPNYTSVHLDKSQANGTSFYQADWAIFDDGVGHFGLLDPDQIIHAVAGDFNNDGNDDIALIYRYPASNNKTIVHLLRSNGNGIAQATGCWSVHDSITAPYLNTNQILHAVAGDFNNDGRDDIALIYKQLGTPNSTRVHLIKSNSDGTSSYQADWAIFDDGVGHFGLLDPDQIIHAVAGDFNNDGNDDIALIYRYPASNNKTIVHLLRSNGNGIAQATGSWSVLDGYPPASSYLNTNQILHAVAGDFNNDGRDDIVLIYKQLGTPNFTVVYLITSQADGTSSFQANWAIFDDGVGHFGLLDPDQIIHAVAGDFNNDGNDDIALIYRYPASNNKTMIHLLRSNGNGIAQATGCWSVHDSITAPYLNTNQILHAVAGNFNNDGLSKRGAPYDDLNNKQSDGSMPFEYELFQNFPNPFNPSTTISFSIPTTTFTSLKVFDLLGREVAIIVSEELSAGSYSRTWNAANMSSGIYFYRLQAGSYTETMKLILLK